MLLVVSTTDLSQVPRFVHLLLLVLLAVVFGSVDCFYEVGAVVLRFEADHLFEFCDTD